MNLVGKIFIVLIFVMSIVFMGFVVAVYSAHTNWRDKVTDPDTGLEAQLKNVQLQVEQLTTQMTKTEEELAAETNARQNQLALLETEKELLEKERDRLNQDYTQKQAEARDAIAAMETAHKTLAALQQEVEKLRTDILTAADMRDTSIASLVAKTDEANGLAMKMETLNKQALEAGEQLSDAMTVLRKFKLSSEPAAYSDTPTQGIAGLVLAAPPNGLVEISIGEDDGLRKGHRLDAYRIAGGLSTYLGKIEVFRTFPDRAVCKVLPEFRRGIIQANDRVSTGLQSQ